MRNAKIWFSRHGRENMPPPFLDLDLLFLLCKYYGARQRLFLEAHAPYPSLLSDLRPSSQMHASLSVQAGQWRGDLRPEPSLLCETYCLSLQQPPISTSTGRKVCSLARQGIGYEQSGQSHAEMFPLIPNTRCWDHYLPAGRRAIDSCFYGLCGLAGLHLTWTWEVLLYSSSFGYCSRNSIWSSIGEVIDLEKMIGSPPPSAGAS